MMYLKLKRIEKGLSQKELCLLTGVKLGSYNKYEKDPGQFKTKDLITICECLDANLSKVIRLIGGIEEEKEV